MTTHPKQKASHVHFGRGGAGTFSLLTCHPSSASTVLTLHGTGNFVTASALETSRKSCSTDSQPSTPTDTPNPNAAGRRYSTGVGGTGNISFARRVKDGGEAQDDDMARLLYDRSAPGIVLAEGGYHTGIGKLVSVRCFAQPMSTGSARLAFSHEADI